MWLLPLFSRLARILGRIFYRVRFAGEALPVDGPLLLVSNHPNALFDPCLVVAASGRPVRFLAKSTLFDSALFGWLVRAVGAIPVYRRMDDPSQVGRNTEMFAAVFEALGRRSAIGLFPEGTSHSDPEMKALKTGAARMALGAAGRLGASFPIVPIGLVFRDKETFRSQALVVRGEPVAWQDLADRGDEDAEAVRQLTERIDQALRRVTLNLERWEDRPLVECAESIYRAHFLTDEIDTPDHVAQVERLERATRLLRQHREQLETLDPQLVSSLWRHERILRTFGLRPKTLVLETTAWKSLLWTVRRLYLLGVPVAIVAVIGWLLFWLPYRLTGWFSRTRKVKQADVATYKLVGGALFYSLWVLGAAAAAGVVGWQQRGLGPGLAMAGLVGVVMPVLGYMGLVVREGWWRALRDLKIFFTFRLRRTLVARLLSRQSSLASRLRQVVEHRGIEAQGVEEAG